MNILKTQVENNWEKVIIFEDDFFLDVCHPDKNTLTQDMIEQISKEEFEASKLDFKPSGPTDTTWFNNENIFDVLVRWSKIYKDFYPIPYAMRDFMKYKDDYESAKIPMLPVVASQKVVASAMLWHSLAMVVASIALGFSAKLSMAYLIVATVLGLAFIYLVGGVRETATLNLEKAAARVFHGSITYLSILSLALTLFALV
jgi:hypothetical protein